MYFTAKSIDSHRTSWCVSVYVCTYIVADVFLWCQCFRLYLSVSVVAATSMEFFRSSKNRFSPVNYFFQFIIITLLFFYTFYEYVRFTSIAERRSISLFIPVHNNHIFCSFIFSGIFRWKRITIKCIRFCRGKNISFFIVGIFLQIESSMSVFLDTVGFVLFVYFFVFVVVVDHHNETISRKKTFSSWVNKKLHIKIGSLLYSFIQLER